MAAHKIPSIIVVSALAVLPFAGIVLAAKAPGSWSDVRIYSEWLALVGRQFWQGDPYPRWLFAANGGEGSPAFVFYGPLAYVLAAPLAWMDAFDPHGFLRFMGLGFVAYVASGVACMGWLRRHADENGAWLGTLAYLAGPYHLIDLYFRAAWTELWAFVWMPLLAMAAEDLARERKHGIAAFVLAFAGLWLTHPPSALIGSAVAVAYALWLGARPVALIAAGAMGLALAAPQWLPAMMLRADIHAALFEQGIFHYSRHFLWFQEGGWHSPAKLAVNLGGVALLALLGLAYRAPRGVRANTRPERFWLWAGLCGFAMASPLAWPLWKVIAPLHYLQFPWRFLLVPSLALAWLACRVPVSGRAGIRTVLVAVLVVGIGGGAVVVVRFMAGTPNPVYGTTLAAHWIPTYEYTPRWRPVDAYRAPRFTARQPVPSVRLTEGDAQLRDVSDLSRGLRFIADVRSERATVEAKMSYFPGWRAWDRATGKEVPLFPARSGAIALTLPHGVRPIEVLFTHVPGERAALGLALLGLMGMAWCSWRAGSGRAGPRPP